MCYAMIDVRFQPSLIWEFCEFSSSQAEVLKHGSHGTSTVKSEVTFNRNCISSCKIKKINRGNPSNQNNNGIWICWKQDRRSVNNV